MVSKLVTAYYLMSLSATLWMVYRHDLRLIDELTVKKTLLILFSGYVLAMALVYIDTLHWENFPLFASLVGFCPLAWYLLVIFLKKCNYEGDLGVLVLSIGLTMLGLLILYRLDIDSAWSLARTVGYERPVPVAFKAEVYSAAALSGIALAIAKGYLDQALQYMEKRSKGDVFWWGLFAATMLILPKLLGLGAVGTQEKSIQFSEAAFKLVFPVFCAKYYESRASELLLKHYPLKEVVKLVCVIGCGVGAFFFIPLYYFQREIGTLLLIALSFILLTTYVTGRFSFFITGMVLLAIAIWLGVYLSPHIERRVVGAWVEWREFAFKPFRPGERLYPGFQLFHAIAAIRLSPWGVGLGNGILKYANMDKTIVPKAVHDAIAAPVGAELGIFGIVLIGLGYFILLVKSLPKNKSLSFRNIFAAGISITVMTQGFYSMSGVFGLLPATGVPIPFISYGGSAVFANFLLIGFMISIINGKPREGPRT